MKVLVIGKNGQVASELGNIGNDNINFKFVGRNEIGIEDDRIKLLSTIVESFQPNAIINTAAYTAVDLAEDHESQAADTNEKLVSELVTVCKQHAIYLVHISTDFVFDGNNSQPYTREDKPNPINTYGMTKHLGEIAMNPIIDTNGCIIRTSWVYSLYGNNFVKTMLNLFQSRSELSIVSDQIGSPTWAKSLADACVSACQNKVLGIQHWTDLGVASWYDFAVAIQDIAFENGLLNNQIHLNPILSSQYPTPTRRPHYSVLDKSAINENFSNLSPKHWRHNLKSMLNRLKQDNQWN